MSETRRLKTNLFRYELKRWVGVGEKGGDNRGEFVEMFQKAVDGRAVGEAWCLSFLQFCAMQTDEAYDEIFQMTSSIRLRIFPTEHVMTMWNKTPKVCRLERPEPGCLILWNWYKNGKQTTSGHAEGVIDVINEEWVQTVGGNTSGPSSKVEREGDVVAMKKRRWDKDTGNMKIVGFLKIW